MTKITEEQVVRSALWAAYGDVVGFPTELITRDAFFKKTGLRSIAHPIDWSRRVGGMFGPDVDFPLGTYSDDTQLRLSTSRAIRGDGFFDVESFAKVELPVWLNYALGAGRGSKAAAGNLSLRDSTWSQNFYSSASGAYWNGGGNGAAMRVQPHVWHAHSHGPNGFIRDVVRNSICTHGHPRAIIGACAHAMLLYQALNDKEAVPPTKWSELGETAAILAYEVLVEDPELSLVWVPNWENKSGNSLKSVWAQTVLEWHQAVDVAISLAEKSESPSTAYQDLIFELGCFRPEERGSGLKTPLLASALAWLFRNSSPEQPLLAAANAFGSDTDTIGTMAGALVGAVTTTEPNVEIQDAEYIVDEARRLFRISLGDKQRSFRYPDLLSWVPPKTQSDSWHVRDGKNSILGLGEAALLGKPYKSNGGTDMTWQWCLLPFGQTVLAKRRGSQGIGVAGNLPPPPTQITVKRPRQLNEGFEEELFQDNIERTHPKELSINERTQACIKSGFNPNLIGEHLLALCTGPDGVEKAVAFAAIVAKAKLTRESK